MAKFPTYKVELMDKKIGYSDDIFNETYLEGFYKNVTFEFVKLKN